jgi:carbamoyltransferase
MSAPQVLVGLGGLLSDAGCCVIKNGRLVSAVEQSKVARRERYEPFPEEAFRSALETAGVQASEIGCIALARPFSRTSESDTLLSLRSQFPNSEIFVVEHHAAHAASAYFASGFDRATVLSIDRAGDYRSAVLYRAEGVRLESIRELYYPDSLGDIFNRVTALLGYQPRSDEHKVQWLSATAEPQYKDVFLEMIGAGSNNGWPRLDRSFLDADHPSYGGFSRRFYKALGLQQGEQIPAALHAPIAASLQAAINETVEGMIGPAEKVCIAGGLALNALLVSHIEQKYKQVFVQPATGNAGTALGAAFQAWHIYYGETAHIPFETLCLGPQFSPEEIKKVLENCKLRFHFLPTEGDLIQRAIEYLDEGRIVAWMHGRMEFGPRALGNRSILASPLNPYSSENLNVYIKRREAFRKFAASVPAELAHEYFELGPNAKFLATVGRVRPNHVKTFQAAILGTDLIRVQAVNKAENPLFHSLLIETGAKTGLPVLYNTSFNLFGDPLVCTPRDAVRSFYSSGIDALFAGNFLLEK